MQQLSTIFKSQSVFNPTEQQKEKFEQDQKLLREVSYSMFTYQPLTKYVIDSFNQFLRFGMKKVLDNSSFKTNYMDKEYTFQFELDGSYKSPDVPSDLTEEKKKTSSAFPHYYRINKKEYVFSVKLNIVVLDGDREIKKIPYEGKIPIMLGSDACNTKFEQDEREMINECDRDPYGYFIVNFEKALVSQEKTLHNVSYVFVKDKKFLCEMLSQNEIGFVSKIALYDAKSVIYSTLSRLNSTKYALTALDMLHVSYLVSPAKSRFSDDSMADYMKYFGVQKTKGALHEAMKDLIGYTFFFCASNLPNKDFIPLPLENYLAETIQESKMNAEQLEELLTKVYEDTIPGSSAPKEDVDAEEDAEEEDLNEEDMEDDEDVQGVANDAWSKWKNLMKKFFYPHVTKFNHKRLVFMHMVSKFMLCASNLKEVDDRDDFGMKKVETPGILMQNLFAKSIQSIKKKIIQKMETEKSKEKQKDTSQLLARILTAKTGSDIDIITQTYHNSFVKDTWGDARTGKKGVTQIVSRFNLPSIYSSLRKLSAHSNRQNKIIKPRMIHPSQYMFVAPEETPDNDRIGLMKHFSVSAYVSFELDPADVNKLKKMIVQKMNQLADWKESGKLTPLSEFSEEEYEDDGDLSSQALVLFNGNPIGFTPAPYELRDALVKFRRSKMAEFSDTMRFISVLVQEENMGPNRVMRYVKINTSGGRILAPFFVNGNPGKIESARTLALDEVMYVPKSGDKPIGTWRQFLASIPMKDLTAICRGKKMKTKEQRKLVEQHPKLLNLFENLVREGVVEYLDSFEVQFTNIALNEVQLVNDKSMTFTHTILNSEFMFGVTSAIMTFIAHNPPPRISLYNNHIKQAVSIPPNNFLERMEPHKEKQKIANYPMQRLIGTYMDEIIGTDDQPIYQNAFVAIYPFEGQAQEDAILAKESSIKKGLFSSTIYQTYTIENPKANLADTKMSKEQLEKYKEGVIKVKMDEERGMKFALDIYQKRIGVVNEFVKRFNRLPQADELIDFDLLLDKLEEEQTKLSDMLIGKNIATDEQLDWRQKKIELENDLIDLVTRIEYLYSLVSKFSQKFKTDIENASKLKNFVKSKPSSTAPFEPFSRESQDKKEQKIEQLEQLMTDLEKILEQNNVDFRVEGPTQVQVIDSKSSQINDLIMLAKMGKRDAEVIKLINKFKEFKPAYDVLEKIISLYNKASKLKEFGSTDNFMDYTKTRKEFEQFCKDNGCLDRLDIVDYQSKREKYGERVKIGADEVLGYSEKLGAGGEKPIMFEGEKGVIDRIHVTLGTYRVRVRDFHIAQVGDKIAGPYAQKGVIAAIVPDTELPFVSRNGLVPDLFVNPLAFPSRLTIGMFLEGFIGKIITQSNTVMVKDYKNDFYIDHVRNGVPVFHFFNDFIHVKHDLTWKRILGFRKNFVSMTNVNNLEKITKETSESIKPLMNTILADFAKEKVVFEDLDNHDQAIYEFLYKTTKVDTNKLALTFGDISVSRSLLSDMPYEGRLLYRKLFARDIVTPNDMIAEDRMKMERSIESLKDYGRAFKEFDPQEMGKFISDLGLYNITEKEFMIDGRTGNPIGEERYCFAREEYLKNVILDYFEMFDDVRASDKEFDMYQLRLLASLPELILTKEAVNDEPQLRLALRQDLKKLMKKEITKRAVEHNLLKPVYKNKKLQYYLMNVDELVQCLNKMDTVLELGVSMNICSGDLVILDKNLEKNLSATDMVVKKFVPTRINVGYVSYMILKHYVHDKIQARDDGPVDIVTRQSTKGKKQGGGNRFGEMEGNALIAHGVPYFYQERLNMVVDKTNMTICQSCGQICTHNARSSSVCPLCKDDSNLANVIAPFSLKILADYYSAMGMKNFIYTKVLKERK